MTRLCQHCSTPYAEGSGVDGFCCAGCRQVYLLIQNEGLDDYYRWQDRAAQPLKDRALAEVDAATFQRVQSALEANAPAPAQAVFKVEGMSCMGCAWLIERLAANQPGLLEAESSLSAHTVRLRWRSAGFDLAAFANELLRFGYHLGVESLRAQTGTLLSPLTLRFLLSAVFTGNALLLAGYTHFVGRASLVDLLSLVCLCFTLLLGAAPFFLAVYRKVQIRRWHSDWFPVLAIVGSIVFFGVKVFLGSMPFSVAAFFVSLLVCILSAARVIGWSPAFRRHHATRPPKGGTPT